MYKLKSNPSDFIVKEISNVKSKEQGRYIYFTLKKENWNTFEVLKKISYILHVPLKNIGYAGTKDKHAITRQLCSIHGVSAKALENITLQGVEISIVGYGNDPISLGDLEGNEFEIVVRNLEISEKIEKNEYFVNYFDEQRFSKNNVAIGKAIVEKKFAKAVELIDYDQCKVHNKKHPTDFVGALKRLPKKLLLLFVHAYQSWIWNETVAGYLQKKEEKVTLIKYSVGTFVFCNNLENYINIEIPLVGFFTELDSVDTDIVKIIETILEEEKISQSDFIIKQIQGLSVEGATRNIVEKIDSLVISPIEDDELHQDKKKVTLTFSLCKGNYATMVVKQLISY
jgi:tRNA pseudouridine13 synthase